MNEINLHGKTVTQSLKLFNEAVRSSSGAICFVIDNETVKLNLYQRAAKLGFKTQLKKEGTSRFLLIVDMPEVKEEKAPKLDLSAKPAFPNAQIHVHSWWFIQHDQIGQRDHSLGRRLMLDAVLSLLNRPVGLYFAHRGVLLFNERVLVEKIAQCQCQIYLCPQSLDFYRINDHGLPRKCMADFLDHVKKEKLICL
ncbi:MAG: hypothetical protein CR997_07845 [Acidobacteria bacterium]|nr:MAG: hypothetical protein CR997_07845 [Acidobacteriota bacterium]